MGLFHSPSPVMAEGKTHLSLVVCGHVDAGKSTTTGHLLFELGGISEREMEKLKEKAAQLGKSSFSFAFYLDTQKDERERGVTISCTTKEFFTDKYHYTIIDAPGHRDFIKNMISGAGQADVALLMVPADKGGFEKAVAKGNRATGEIEGQTRQHSRLINLLGVEKVIVGVNKMDNTPPTPSPASTRSPVRSWSCLRPLATRRTRSRRSSPSSRSPAGRAITSSRRPRRWPGTRASTSRSTVTRSTLTLSRMPSTMPASPRSARMTLPCAPVCPVCTRSRVSVM